jgi:hypothetical protein
MEDIRNWLTYLKREINEPDLWEQLAAYQLSKSDQLDINQSNDPFMENQVEQITQGILRIRGYLKTEFNFNEQQLNEVSEKLDYLTEAARRQGRKDWFHTAIGVIFSLAVSLALSPEQAKNIWGILRDSLSGVIKLLP